MSAITNTLDGRWLADSAADSLTSDDLVDQAFLALSRCPHCGRVPNRPNRPNSAVCDACLTRCRHCTIYIFPSAIEAAAAAVPWAPTVNLAVGDLCIGCAGDNIASAPPHLVYEQLATADYTAVTMSAPVSRPDEGEPTMAIQDATKNELYQAFEIGVQPPIVGKAKYAPLATRLLAVPIGKNGFSDWIRVTFADAPSAKRARSYLGTLRSQWRTEGHDAEFQTVPNGETCYLYIRRKVAVDTAATVAAAEPREGAA